MPRTPKPKALDASAKYTIADAIVAVLINQPAYADFSNKSKEVQYGILFSQVINGLTLVDHYGKDDGPHIVGLVRHRLNNPATQEVEIDLP